MKEKTEETKTHLGIVLAGCVDGAGSWGGLVTQDIVFAQGARIMLFQPRVDTCDVKVVLNKERSCGGAEGEGNRIKTEN